MITISYSPNSAAPTHINIFSPYDRDFISAARALGGRFVKFDSGREGWQFPFDIKDDALEAVRRVYGVDPTYKADELATVRLRFPRGAVADKQPIILCGHEIAAARGRDSGARPGTGVSIVEGKADSGGSAANWVTRLSEGAVVVIRDFPTKYLQTLPQDVELLSTTITRPASEAAPPAPTEAQIQEAVALLERAGYTVTRRTA